MMLGIIGAATKLRVRSRTVSGGGQFAASIAL